MMDTASFKTINQIQKEEMKKMLKQRQRVLMLKENVKKGSGCRSLYKPKNCLDGKKEKLMLQNGVKIRPQKGPLSIGLNFSTSNMSWTAVTENSLQPRSLLARGAGLINS